MLMSPKLKENVEITWRVLALSMLSFCVWFLIRINDKIDYSYDANVKQQEINKNVAEKLDHLIQVSRKLDLDFDRLADRQFQYESKRNRQ